MIKKVKNINKYYIDRGKYNKRMDLRLQYVRHTIMIRMYDNLHAQQLFISYARIMTFKRLSILDLYECIKLENRELRMYLVTRLAAKFRSDRYAKEFYQVHPNYSKD